MADDALTRKDAEMRLTREEILVLRPNDSARDNIVAGIAAGTYRKLCDLALRALSLESVREEANTRIRIAELNALAAKSAALEEAAKVCDTYAGEAEANFVHEKMYAAQGCADRIRALKAR